ncbi:hypothetical protein [Leptothermofonsia sp. ETS-13]|uniref:hypothetical protein n=1 Tax=Leptothermofonsia sp. ETS-13 TaxID=3035696 RepID=UPI003B9F025E
MELFRNRLHLLIDQLSDEELADMWEVLAELCYDLYMQRAIQASKRLLNPGDTFTREEALQFLSLM